MNDNAPYLTSPNQVRITENSKPEVVSQVTLGDPDDWRLGHGPPFSLQLDPNAPQYITNSVKVQYNPGRFT